MVGAYLILGRNLDRGKGIVHGGGALATLAPAHDDVQHLFDGENGRQSSEAQEVGTAELRRTRQQVARLPGEPSIGHVAGHT